MILLFLHLLDLVLVFVCLALCCLRRTVLYSFYTLWNFLCFFCIFHKLLPYIPWTVEHCWHRYYLLFHALLDRSIHAGDVLLTERAEMCSLFFRRVLWCTLESEGYLPLVGCSDLSLTRILWIRDLPLAGLAEGMPSRYHRPVLWKAFSNVEESPPVVEKGQVLCGYYHLDWTFLWAFALASNTILNFVVRWSFLITGWCGKKNSVHCSPVRLLQWCLLSSVLRISDGTDLVVRVSSSGHWMCFLTVLRPFQKCHLKEPVRPSASFFQGKATEIRPLGSLFTVFPKFSSASSPDVTSSILMLNVSKFQDFSEGSDCCCILEQSIMEKLYSVEMAGCALRPTTIGPMRVSRIWSPSVFLLTGTAMNFNM